VWLAVFASAARATISPTIPRWSIFAFSSRAHLDLIKRLIIIAMENINVRLDYFLILTALTKNCPNAKLLL
jgi:hypothetical protein